MNKRDVMRTDGADPLLWKRLNLSPSYLRKVVLIWGNAHLTLKILVSNRHTASCNRECGELSHTFPVPFLTWHGLWPCVCLQAEWTHTPNPLCWPDYVLHLGAVGVGAARVAGEGQQTVSDSRPSQEMFSVRRLFVVKPGLLRCLSTFV